jgi:hypothetical protein
MAGDDEVVAAANNAQSRTQIDLQTKKTQANLALSEW